MEYLNLPGIIIAFIIIVFGIVSCFYGSNIFKFLLVIIGFFVGAYITGRFGTNFTADTNILLVSAIVGGVILGLIVLLFYYTGIFFSGVAVVILISSYFKLNYHNTDHLIILIILCAIGGVLALIFHNFVLSFATAIIGAWCITNGFGFLIYYIKYRNQSIEAYLNFIKSNASLFYLLILCTIVLSILGIIHQFKLSHDE